MGYDSPQVLGSKTTFQKKTATKGEVLQPPIHAPMNTLTGCAQCPHQE